MPPWENAALGKCRGGKCRLGKMPPWECATWENAYLGKCRLGKMPPWEVATWEVAVVECAGGKVPGAKCPRTISLLSILYIAGLNIKIGLVHKTIGDNLGFDTTTCPSMGFLREKTHENAISYLSICKVVNEKAMESYAIMTIPWVFNQNKNCDASPYGPPLIKTKI